MDLQAWHIWALAGLVLWIVEIFTSGFILGLFGTACIAAALASTYELGIKGQFLVFVATTAILTLGLRPLAMRYLSRRRESETNVDALIGATGLVTERIDHLSNTGTVKVGNEEWRAVVEGELVVPEGKRVRIEKVEGCKLIVVPEDSTPKARLQ